METYPSYHQLYENDDLPRIAEQLEGLMKECTICPRQCRVNRFESAGGYCRTGKYPVVSSAQPHFGEEPPLVGHRGSGTVFFTNCNLACVFCQNYTISHLGRGKEISYLDLAEIMLDLQRKGCHNINFVTPTHMIYQICMALEYAVPRGLSVPLVYNTGGYDSPETLKLIEGIFDIYMPDFKYYNNEYASRYSDVPDYSAIAQAAITEMHRQVGDLQEDKRGIARRGVIIRHLVLPNLAEDSRNIIDFVAGLSKETYFNCMDQYRPEYHARDFHELSRPVARQDFQDIIMYAQNQGLKPAGY